MSKDFDDQLIDNLEHMTVDEAIAKKINPWNKPLGFILTGLVLTTILLDFLWLQFILPSIGVILLYIGFRILRKENEGFKDSFFLSILYLILHSISLIFASTPLNTDKTGVLIIGIIIVLLRIFILLRFRSGVLKVKEKSKSYDKGDPVVMLILCNIIVYGFFTFNGDKIWIFPFAALMILYFIAVTSIYRLGDHLVSLGYDIRVAPVKLSNKTVSFLFGLIFTVVVSVCSVFSNHIKLTPNEFIKPEYNDKYITLFEMGFPRDVLNALPGDKIEMLSDAVNVTESTNILKFYSTKLNPGRKNLEVTSLFIEMPDKKIYGLIYFNWQDIKAYWRDGFTLSSDACIDVIDGKLIYEIDDSLYCSDIPHLKKDPGYISGDVCFPFGSNKQRGYILYRIEASERTCTVFRYSHDYTPFELPYEEASTGILQGTRSYKQHYSYFRYKEN